MWTIFNDMHSGGGKKLEWESIAFEADIQTAIIAFEILFQRSAYHETCSCCGEDFSISEIEDSYMLDYEHCHTIKAPEVLEIITKAYQKKCASMYAYGVIINPIAKILERQKMDGNYAIGDMDETLLEISNKLFSGISNYD